MSETLGKVQNVATDPKRLILRNSAEFGDPTYENAELEKNAHAGMELSDPRLFLKLQTKMLQTK